MFDTAQVLKFAATFLGGLLALFTAGILLKMFYLTFMLGWNLA